MTEKRMMWVFFVALVSLIAVLTLMTPRKAAAGVLDLFSNKTRQYIKKHGGETKIMGTKTFNGTYGYAIYLPVRWLGKKTRYAEFGVGYHNQEGGDEDVLANFGLDLVPLLGLLEETSFGKKYIGGIPLPPIWLSVYIDAYTGETWVIGQKCGWGLSTRLFFGG